MTKTNDIFTQKFENPNQQTKKQGPNYLAMVMKYAPQVIQLLKNKVVLYSIIGIIAYVILSGVVLNVLLFFWFPYVMFSIVGGLVIVSFGLKIRKKVREVRGKKTKK